jgi:hypothetical protein
MVNNKCSKNFPYNFREETIMSGRDCRPEYQRLNNGHSFVDRKGQIFTSQDVVPFNGPLLKMFKCHINVDIPASMNAVRYILNYMFKGHDCLMVRSTLVDASDPAPDEGNY